MSNEEQRNNNNNNEKSFVRVYIYANTAIVLYSRNGKMYEESDHIAIMGEANALSSIEMWKLSICTGTWTKFLFSTFLVLKFVTLTELVSATRRKGCVK